MNRTPDSPRETGPKDAGPIKSEVVSVTPAARWLGYAGLLPQILCVWLVLSGHEYRYSALAGGFAYAAAIFSFLGGVWWGQAVASNTSGQQSGAGDFVIAVLPSLIAVAAFLPWTFGADWPGPSLIWIGAFIVLSPVVDHRLGFASPDFFRLRVQLSIGLGVLTIALGIMSKAVV